MAFMDAPKTGEGNFTVFVKYDAKAGRWFTKEDEKDAPLFEVKDMTAMFDMDSLQTGWFLFAAGMAPVKQFDPSLTEAGSKPEGKFKRGFQLNVYSEKNLLGLREFGSTAGVVIEAMNTLHDHWLAGRGDNPGKLPVVKCVGIAPVIGSHGTNYQPQLEIVAWKDRPAEMSGTATKAEPKQEAKREPEPANVGAGDDDVEY